MPVEPKDLLDCARRLVSEGAESDWRASVSRAYYSSYHALSPLCAYLPVSCDAARTADWITHGELIARIDQWLPTGAYIGLKKLKVSAQVALRQLRTARELRVAADYHLKIDITHDDAKQQIARAVKLSTFAHQVREELGRSVA